MKTKIELQELAKAVNKELSIAISDKETLITNFEFDRIKCDDVINSLKKQEQEIKERIEANNETHWITRPDERTSVAHKWNIHGIKEDEILERGLTYIVIGAEEIHRHKPIMKAEHKMIDAPFVRSRRKDNRIWIWNG